VSTYSRLSWALVGRQLSDPEGAYLGALSTLLTPYGCPALFRFYDLRWAVYGTRALEQGHSILSEVLYDRWTGGYLPGTNKEVFDAELYAIYRAVMRFGKRRERDQEYTIFVDSQAAMKRCLTDNQGPGQETARAIIRLSEGIARRGDKLRLQWVPSHAEVGGNEVADRMAKEAAASELYGDSESRRFSHGQAWPTSRGGQPKPKREERKCGLRKGQRGADLTFHRKKQGSARNYEGDRVEALSAADRTCLDRTLP